MVAKLSAYTLQATFGKFLNHQALGRRQANTFVADMQLTYTATVYEYYYDGNEQYAKPFSTTEAFEITLTPQAKATIAALKAAGVFAESGVELRTNSGALHTP